MMKKEKILQVAENHLVHRRLSQAIHEYQKLLKLEPNHTSLLNTVGDLLLLDDRTEEALEYFHQVAEIYFSRGFSLKAIAMFRKILGIDPEDLDSRHTLASLFEKKGLNYDAGLELNHLADHYEACEDWTLLFLCLQRWVELEPGNALLWRRYARLILKEGRAEAAVECFMRAIRLLEEQDETELVHDLALEALEADNRQRDVLLSFVTAAESLGRLSHAEEFVRELIESEGSEFPHLLFLAWILEKQGDMEGAGQLYTDLLKGGYQDPLIGEGLIRTGLVEGGLLATGLEETEPDDFPLWEAETERESAEIVAFRELDSPADHKLISKDAEVSEGSPFDTEDGGTPVSADEEWEGVADSGESTERELSLEESLEEIDFSLKLGAQEDARRLLRTLTKRFPGEERVLRRMASVMPGSGLADLGKPSWSDKEVSDFEADIESALQDLFTGGRATVAPEVLRYDVKVPDGNGSQNPELHYELGLAYKEMGLAEDALREFLKANELAMDANHVPQQILCSRMLATSYLEMEDYDEAARWAEVGLALPDAKDFEWKALKYELAMALEKRRYSERALEVYEEIFRTDPNYKDVGDRLEGLRETIR